jgi:prefoldin subunit 4
MMGSGDKVLLMQGEAFFEVTENEATGYCEAAVDVLQAKMSALDTENESVMAQQAQLKQILYGRFGKSINLEDKE